MARKVVHLGDQLEASNNCRQRDIEALNLLEVMKDFSERAKPSRPEFTEPTRVSMPSVLLCLCVYNSVYMYMYIIQIGVSPFFTLQNNYYIHVHLYMCAYRCMYNVCSALLTIIIMDMYHERRFLHAVQIMENLNM